MVVSLMVGDFVQKVMNDLKNQNSVHICGDSKRLGRENGCVEASYWTII